MSKVKLRSLLLGTYISFITSVSPLAFCQDAAKTDTDPQFNNEYVSNLEVIRCANLIHPSMSDYLPVFTTSTTTQSITTSLTTGSTSSITTTTTTTTTTVEMLSTTNSEVEIVTIVTTEADPPEPIPAPVDDEVIDVVDSIVSEVITTSVAETMPTETTTTEITDVEAPVETTSTTTAPVEEAPVETTLPITDQEFILIANVISHEAGCSWIGEYERACIVAAIMNRVNDSRWPSTIDAVVHQPYQMFDVPYYRVDYSGIGYDVVDNAIYAYFNGTYDCGSVNSWWGDGRNNHFYTI